MKKAVVTGGAGFIGSHLSHELFTRGYRVTILDDLSTGKEDNILDLLEEAEGGVGFIKDTILKPDLLVRLFDGADYVFHLAAIASVPASIRDPILTHQVNLTGTLNVLQAARCCGVKKVIFFSSAAVYGDTPTLPQREDTMPAPLSPYAVNKLAAERYCDVFKKAYCLNTVSLRFFNVFGPRQDPASQYAAAIPRFITLALNGEAPVIFGDGQQTRDFIYVRDAAAAAILAAESDAGGVYNVGGGRAVTVNETVRLILKTTGKDLAPVHKAPRPGDILHSLADVTRLRRLGFQPAFTFEQGLRATAEYYSGRTAVLASGA